MYTIGIDLGGTNIAAGIVDENYNIVKKASTPTNASRSADEITADIAALCKKLTEDMELTLKDIQSIGIATPGTANSETGEILYANNLPFNNYPMEQKLSDFLGYTGRVHIANDANAAAKAEAVAGAAKGSKYSVMITLGTGVGGGIILDGQVYSGFNHAGAELGHIVIVKDGRQCTCGRRGCWETYSSATGLIRTTRERLEEARKAGRKTVIEEMIVFPAERHSALCSLEMNWAQRLLTNTYPIWQPGLLILSIYSSRTYCLSAAAFPTREILSSICCTIKYLLKPTPVETHPSVH